MNEIEQISFLLERYKQFSEKIAVERIDDFKQSFQVLLGHYNSFRSEITERNKEKHLTTIFFIS